MAKMSRVVSAVKVKVDSFDIAIVPGSLEYKTGHPEREVKGTDTGDVVFSENFESAIGMVKLEMYATPENLNTATTIQSSQGSSVKFYDESGFQRVMKTGVTKNDSSRSLGSDGKIELNFEGTPIEFS